MILVSIETSGFQELAAGNERARRAESRVIFDSAPTPLGLPQWSNGICATRRRIGDTGRVAQNPLNHRDEPGGGKQFATGTHHDSANQLRPHFAGAGNWDRATLAIRDRGVGIDSQ